MWGFFFNQAPVTNYAEAKRSDTSRYARFFHAMLDLGIYLAPSQFESAFVSSCHDEQIVEQTLVAARQALRVASQE
jgi:glutamate-1-semialdehyde 2,1-aminomutase